MMRFIRLLGGGLGVILAISLAGFGGASSEFFSASLEGRLLFGAWIAAWFVVGYAILPYITVVPARWLMEGVDELSTGEFVTAILGLLLGLLMGLLLGLPLANLPDPYGFLLPLGVSVVLGLGMMGLTVAKRQDLLQAAHDVGLLMRKSADGSDGLEGRARSSAPITYLDTSAIIDGRLVDVVASGFLYGTLVVPRFVLGELQHIADDEQAGRRTRGRRGLEVLSVLQKDHRVDLELTDEDAHEIKAVDAKLVALARAREASVLTHD